MKLTQKQLQELEKLTAQEKYIFLMHNIFESKKPKMTLKKLSEELQLSYDQVKYLNKRIYNKLNIVPYKNILRMESFTEMKNGVIKIKQTEETRAKEIQRGYQKLKK